MAIAETMSLVQCGRDLSPRDPDVREAAMVVTTTTNIIIIIKHRISS